MLASMSAIEFREWEAKLIGDAEVRKLITDQKMDPELAWRAVWGAE
jgi:hypothetical protein